ncbi:hypothetical protein Dimus_012051 [Dionaea muscipula]
MPAKKLLGIPCLRQIPSIVLNSLKLAHNSTTQLNPPFKPQTPLALSTDLIKCYSEKGLPEEARKLFDEMPERDVVVWTAMIAGYTTCNCNLSAWMLFSDMLRVGVEPNAFTISSTLKACTGLKSYLYGRLVHGLAVTRGLVGFVYVDNALIDVYAACSVSMDEASAVFQDIPVKNFVTWTTLISGYTHQGDGYGALAVFRKMLYEQAELSPFCISISVRACASIGAGSFGRQLHAIIIKKRLQSSVPVMNSIVDMYCRCDCLSEASQCFNEMTQKNLITWNTLVSGYGRSNSIECLHIFTKMDSEGFSPDCFTFTSVVAACADIALLNCGQQLHAGIASRGFNADMALANALVDMYAKCGSIVDSRKIFSEMPCWNVLSWTSMMIGYGTHGYEKEAIELFEQMLSTGVKPDRVVFTGVLNACSHAGLVDEGLKYFELMVGKYNIAPDQEIYGCVVDLLGRAGRVEEAYELINNMPFELDDYVLKAFIGACKTHKFPSLGKLAAQRLSGLRSNMARTYKMLSNMYAANGQWEESARMRKLVKGLGSEEVGSSWLELKNEVYRFVVGDTMGSLEGWDHEVLNTMIQHMKTEERAHNMDCLLHDLKDGVTDTGKRSIEMYSCKDTGMEIFNQGSLVEVSSDEDGLVCCYPC